MTMSAPAGRPAREPGTAAEGRAFWSAVAERSPFTLPAAWAPEPAGSSGWVESAVPFADLDRGLAALAGDGIGLSAVLLAAHQAVLGMLSPDRAARSGVWLPAEPGAGPGQPLPVPVRRDAPTWRALAAAVRRDEQAARRHRPAAPAAVRRPGGGRPVHALFDAGAGRPDTPAGYGLHVLAAEGRLRLRVAATAVAPAHVQRLAAMYRAVLEAMAAGPDGDPRTAYLPPGERETVLADWGSGPAVDRGAATVVELIRAQASATPGAVAVRVSGGTLSYRELDERSDRIAQHLAALGAGPDVLVGLCLRRTADLLPALLGIWKAGAAYLPLDPELPAGRLRQMVAAAGCPLVVTTTALRPLLGDAAGAAPVLLDAERAVIAARPATPPRAGTDPARLAYVIYTSGSTGAPKGVMVEHGGLANYLLWTVEAYASRGTGGAPVFSSISFDLGIPDLLAPLLAGQPVHLLPQPLDLDELGPELAGGGPYSFVKMTPGHLDLLTYQLLPEEVRDLAGLAIGAGDSFTAALAARWIELAGPGGTAVATEYGPTEITIGNSGQPITGPPATELVPLGRPIPNTTMYVLTDRLEPAPVGVVGEVYVGGSGVARGYLGRPDLTADRFLPDPHGAAGARLYRTGDVARWLPDGSLEFLGRLDNQVKIRGYRVELGEIQAALRRHPQVRDAVVVAQPAPAGGKRLVAYAVLAAGQPLDAAALHAHLAAALPDYMIPAAFVAIDRIPLTANGKVDGRALPALL